MWFTEHLLRVYLDFLRHIYSSLWPTPFQVRIFRSFLRIFIASCILSPEAGAGLGILSIWSLYQNLLSFYWSSLFKVYDFPYFFLLMENLGQGFCLFFFFFLLLFIEGRRLYTTASCASTPQTLLYSTICEMHILKTQIKY